MPSWRARPRSPHECHCCVEQRQADLTHGPSPSCSASAATSSSNTAPTFALPVFGAKFVVSVPRVLNEGMAKCSGQHVRIVNHGGRVVQMALSVGPVPSGSLVSARHS